MADAAITSRYQFPSSDLESHPLCERLAESARGPDPVRILLLLGLGCLCGAGLAGLVTNAWVPWVLVLAGVQFCLHLQSRDLHRLRDSGVLRELSLTAQPSLLTLAVHHRASAPRALKRICCVLLFGFAILAVKFAWILAFISTMPLVVVCLFLVFAAIWTLVACGLLGYLIHRPAPPTHWLERAQVVRLIGRSSVLTVVAPTLYLLPPVAAHWSSWASIIMANLCPLLVLALSFRPLPSERHLLTVSDAEFEDWVREWCVHVP